MLSILRWTCSVAALMLVPSSLLVEAKACTSTQLTQLTSIAATFSGSPDCAGSALDSSTNSVDVICAGACMKLIRELQSDAPDCEYDGSNLGETMSTLVSWCDAASSSGSASALASSSGSSSASGSADAGSNSSSVATSDTVPICSMENVTLIDDVNSEAATNADCFGSAGAATSATSKTDYCNENSCIAYLTDVEGRLPNCTYGGYNLKQVIADVLALCDDPNLTWAPSTTPPTTTTTTTAPLATTQTPTVASSGSSQTTDTPAPAKSAASALNWDVSVVLLLAIVFAVGNL